MKNTALLIFFFALGIHITAKAQIGDAASLLGGLVGPPTVVTDPTNKAQLITIVAEARKSYEVVKKQLEFVEEAKKALNKINKTVRQVRLVSDIADIQREIFQLNKESLNTAQSLKVDDINEVVDVITAVNNNLIASESTLNIIQHLLQDDLLEMTSGERLILLMEMKREAQSYRATARFLDRQIRHYATLEFLDRIYAQSSPSLYRRN